jgi:hypothetical protein
MTNSLRAAAQAFAAAQAAHTTGLLAAVADFFTARGGVEVVLGDAPELVLHPLHRGDSDEFTAPAVATAAGFEGGEWVVPTVRTGTLRSAPSGPGAYSHRRDWDDLNAEELAAWVPRLARAAE